MMAHVNIQTSPQKNFKKRKKGRSRGKRRMQHSPYESAVCENMSSVSQEKFSPLQQIVYTYMFKAFIRARNHFGMSEGKIPSGISAKDFLFDPSVICKGEQPPNRGCLYCGQTDHLISDCPKKIHDEQN